MTTNADIQDLDRSYVFHSWSAQDLIAPLPVQSGEGSYFWDYEGNKYLDFTSQLVNLNLGHQHPRLIQAIKDQADRLATVAPSFAEETRSKLAQGIIDAVGNEYFANVFFTNGGTDAVEHAVRMARLHTGRRKVMSMYRSYHGATATAISLTGDPRRWANEPSDTSVVHFFGPYLYRSMFYANTPEEESERALKHLEQQILLEGPETIAAIIIESVVGTNGILVPPPGYLEGVRKLCDAHGIMYIADEVMAGFGRTGAFFAYQHFNVVPDLITFAKGVNSGYVPLGGVVISHAIRATFGTRAFPGGLTYSGHSLACAPGVETLKIFEEEQTLAHVNDLADRIIKPRLEALADKFDCVGEVRGVGMFWAIEFVKNKATREPLVPFNPSAEENAPMLALAAGCKERGLWPFTHFNRMHVVPPLNISEAELEEGLDIIEAAIEATLG
ncbi:aspartate aminotransferase family protein [Corynebacterium freiburgense]|uniref:aspartate aminotransferase family protein n=1 Tax=Corynebacterium freiburgense TaxID=556548 RepID=UPI0004197085|nr:aspartate aminotransferase family protein [Corynebacterium freiburgense]WJZ02767.1 5-aminovalerate aminotransferase DavT [Corynebacterium freiburgense]